MNLNFDIMEDIGGEVKNIRETEQNKQKFDEVVNILNIAFHDNADILYHMEGGWEAFPEDKPLHWDTHKDHPDIIHLYDNFFTNIVYMGNTLWWYNYDDYDEVAQDDQESYNHRYFMFDTCVDWTAARWGRSNTIPETFRSWWWKQGEIGWEHNAGDRAEDAAGNRTIFINEQ